LAIRDMRHIVNGERRSRAFKVLTGAFVPWLLIVMPFGRKGKQLERRADALRNLPREISKHWSLSSEALSRPRAGSKRSGTISESVRLVRGVDGGAIAMRIEYLAAIAIAAFTGLAVYSVGSLSPRKQSTPAAAQLATLFAESVDPFLRRSGG